jgi:hypothetical protein
MFFSSQSGMQITKVPSIIVFEKTHKDLRNQKCLNGAVIFLANETYTVYVKLKYNYQLTDTNQNIYINLWVNDIKIQEKLVEIQSSHLPKIDSDIIEFFTVIDVKENDLFRIEIFIDSEFPIFLSTKELQNTLTIL